MASAILFSAGAGRAEEAVIRPIDPPERAFYAKRLDYDGIPIKAPKEVADEALLVARGRLAMMLSNLPSIRANLTGGDGVAYHRAGPGHV